MPEPAQYPHVFSPFRLGPVEIPNRVYFSPHGVIQSLMVSDEFLWYFDERAAGGVGLLIHSTAEGAQPGPGVLLPHDDAATPAFARVADAVHGHGSRLFAQISYWLNAPGIWGANAPLRPWLAPSQLGHFMHSSVGRAMTHEDISWMIRKFAGGVANLRRAGYDGVQLHFTHGMLVETFMSEHWNRRTDEYGGSPENRLRFPRELLEAVREAAGPDMALGIRFNCDEQLPDGFDEAGSREILSALCRDGLIDFVDLDTAVEPEQMELVIPSHHLPKFLYEPTVRAVRSAAGSIPVLSALGRITTVAEAERALAEGVCDMVGIARGLVAEPNLLRHARDGQEERSRACTGCNYCAQQLFRGQGFACAINPATMRERRWSPRVAPPAPTPSRVVVVGGGPAGLEGARVAAERGHDVVLLERSSELGGQYRLWGRLPGRAIMATTIPWYARELARLGVDVRLEQEATADDVLALAPDAVLVATGSQYASNGESGFIPAPIAGAAQPFVYTPEQILHDGVRPRGRVIILDDEGLNAGVGIAELLAGEGASVEIVTRWPHVAHNLGESLEQRSILPNIRRLGVTFRPLTYVRSIGAGGELTLYDVSTKSGDTQVHCDGLVLCTLRMPRSEIAEALDGRVDQLFPIGDALGSRDHATAFYEAALFARMIGEPDAPRTFTEAYHQSDPVFPREADTVAAPGTPPKPVSLV
jgi:2,4-dienoyl-CoA reductase-like NADH-dependent reductase (Old Yellow Enzyme family)